MNKALRGLVRDLRKNQTNAERILWDALRNRKVGHKKFLRQHPLRFRVNGKIKFFVADFYCAELRLVIEIDGKIHLKQRDYDEMRTRVIEQLGMKVIRFTNEEIENRLNYVIRIIKNELSPLTPPAAPLSPLGERGGGEWANSYIT